MLINKRIVMQRTRYFTTSKRKNVNSKNGRELDRTQHIVDYHNGDKGRIEKYFEEKKHSIVKAYRDDSNSAAATGVSASELNQWLNDHKERLEELEGQKDDVHDLCSDSEDDEKNNEGGSSADGSGAGGSSAGGGGSSIGGSTTNNNSNTATTVGATSNNTSSVTTGDTTSAHSNTGGSLLDDYADTSTEQPDYTGGDD